MMYPYITLPDETAIVHSQILNKDGVRSVEVYFERPVETGFDSARCSLPDYTWIERKGFTDEEIGDFTLFLENNAHLIYRFAERGGACCA